MDIPIDLSGTNFEKSLPKILEKLDNREQFELKGALRNLQNKLNRTREEKTQYAIRLRKQILLHRAVEDAFADLLHREDQRNDY